VSVGLLMEILVEPVLKPAFRGRIVKNSIGDCGNQSMQCVALL
jgi:hypothetical protein